VNRLTPVKGGAIKSACGTIWAKREGRGRNWIVQRSPVRKFNMRCRTGTVAFQRATSLTAMTTRISRVHESWDSVAREIRVSAANAGN
jgi:hypothetical protein